MEPKNEEEPQVLWHAGDSRDWMSHRHELPNSAWRDLWTPRFMIYENVYNTPEPK